MRRTVHRRQQHPQLVDRAKHDVGHPGFERASVVAQDAQDVLHGVRQVADLEQAQHRCTALDRVRGQKHGPHGLHIQGVPLELQELRVERGQVVGHFGPELLEERDRVDAHVRTPCSRIGTIACGGSTWSTTPRLMAAAGMPKTTELASSWAIVVPPARLSALRPTAPSSPIPVNTTPMAVRPYSRATEANRCVADGRWSEMGGPSTSATACPRTPMWCPGGATTIPGRSSIWPSVPSSIGSAHWGRSQSTRLAAKSSAMC